MKNKIKLLVSLMLIHSWASFGHEKVVHQHITMSAESVLAAQSVGYNAFLNTITHFAPDIDQYGHHLLTYAGDNRPIAGEYGWMTIGAMEEDDVDVDVGGKRPINHFYNPLNGQGLSDIPPFEGDGNTIYGVDSFDWGAWFNEPGINSFLPAPNYNTTNEWTWQNVRQYEWSGLTNFELGNRLGYLAQTFEGLGHVVHLLQDTSQPQHVRNEQHLSNIGPFPSPYHSAIEKYGADHWRELNYSANMLDWRSLGFDKLKDFWDRGFYRVEGVQALDDDASGNARQQLGLAEFSNGNFVGKTATYPEYFTPSDRDYSKHYFSYPSLRTSTSFPNVRTSLGYGLRTVYLRNGQLANRVYLDKTGDGITFSDCSVLTYFGVKFRSGRQFVEVSSTIQDDKVLKAYHDILIPKAVAYTAGLVDYFFRGTMSAAVVDVEASVPQYTVAFTNTSSQDFSGGNFYVFQQDSAGNRSLVGQTNLMDLLPDGILATNSSVEATFSGDLPTNQLIFLYQGTIGVSNGAPLDPVDAGMAIAISVPPAIRVTANPLWTDSGLTVTNGETLGILAWGTWSWGETADANGVNDGSTDLFLGGVNHAALIAYVGTYPPYDDATGTNRWGDSSYFPETPGHGYWLAGKNAQITTDRGGELWFLINDDAVTEQISDNSGALSVTVFTGN